jgi:hypothetical protein
MTRAAKKPAPRGPRRAGAVLLALTVEEREELRRAAERDAIPLAVWARSTLLKAARASGWLNVKNYAKP